MTCMSTESSEILRVVTALRSGVDGRGVGKSVRWGRGHLASASGRRGDGDGGDIDRVRTLDARPAGIHQAGRELSQKNMISAKEKTTVRHCHVMLTNGE